MKRIRTTSSALLLALVLPLAAAAPSLGDEDGKQLGALGSMLPPEVGAFTLQSIELQDFIRMLRLMDINAETGHSLDNVAL